MRKLYQVFSMNKMALRVFTIALTLFCSLPNLAFSQDVKITGRVIDGDSKEPILGASVYVNGTSRGTSTAIDGSYTLLVPKDASRITVSFIGYEDQTLLINGKNSTVNISLKPSSVYIDEVVAIGYGTARRSEIASAIASVGEADIAKTPVTSVDQALQGNAAGVLVINTSAEPGGEVSMRIRGGSSVSGDNEPLIVIDDFPADKMALTMLNPNDVLSMDVLKDASATAIFGSRGANGVVMIRTKSGQAGKAKVSVLANIGVSSPRYMLEMMDGPEYTRYSNLARITSGEALASLLPDTMGTRDYQDMLIRKMALRQEYNVSVSGGSKEMKYYVSAGYIKEQGILNRSNNNRLTFNGKFDVALAKNVMLKFTSNIGTNDQDKVGGGATRYTVEMNPSSSKTGLFQDGLWVDEETGEVTSTESEIASAMNGNNLNKNWSASMNAALNWKISNAWSFNVNGSYKFSQKKEYGYMPRRIYNTDENITKNNKATRKASDNIQWVNENFFNYSKTISKNHSVNVVFGQSWQENKEDGFGVVARRFDTDYFLYDYLPAAMYYDTPSSIKNRYSLLSFYTRGKYNYKQRYFTSVSFRSDGSSRFGSDRKFGYFPAADFAWVMTNEAWMKDVRWLSIFKPRISWGITGNDKIGNYQSMSQLESGQVLINGNPQGGLMSTIIGNPTLQWETSQTTNFGLELGFIDNRIQVVFDMYNKRTYDLLYTYMLPQTSGYTSVMANVGSVRNRGFEVELRTVNINTKRFTWSTSANIGYNQSKVLDLGGNDDIPLYYLGNNIKSNLTFLMVGQPMGVFKGYRTSIYRTWDEVYADNSVWVEETIPTQPGMLKYTDRDGNGVIDEDDKEVLGQAQPKLTGGFTSTMTYRNFDFQVFLYGAYGGSILNTGFVKTKSARGGDKNQMSQLSDSFRPMNPATGDPGNPDGKFPLPLYNKDNPYVTNLTDKLLEDGSFLRVKAITLGYTFPVKAVRRMGMSSLRLSVSGNDLFTWTKYKGYDPEKSSSIGSSNSKLGIDDGSYPAVKTITFTLNIGF